MRYSAVTLERSPGHTTSDSFWAVARYAAFLRAINVGGRTATKDRLVAPFEACGFVNVSTFRASGNVLFEAPGNSKPKQAEIESALEAELGFEVPVFLRSAAQLAKIAALDPFSAKQLKASKGKLQVAFLPKKPTKAEAAEALALELESDPLSWRARSFCGCRPPARRRATST